ncbi:MAG TPA: acetyl-CoA carboxylase biotin carboxyl carrier protein [Blastocatellia bacterium]|nr:acetyl-CoA carboxylase biotin carboxyl carrier protein [Blastocatellia bacterium]
MAKRTESKKTHEGPSMNLKEVKELIELISEKGFTEFEIERQGFRMRLGRHNQPPAQSSTAPPVIAVPIPPIAPATPAAPSRDAAAEPAQPAVAPSAQPLATEEDDSKLHIIKSPLVGTFYRSPSPASDPFVKVGDQVEPETVVCIIEAMKLMNNILAEVSGEIAKIYAENGQPVEYGQPLFGIRM